MSKVLHMSGLPAHKMIIYHLIFLFTSFNSVWAGILIYDGDLGIEEFRDVELTNTEPINKDGIMGAIVAASPIDACVNISRPPNLNTTLNWFVLINGNSCTFEVKVLNARYAGYAAAVIYITETRIPRFIRSENGYYSYFPNISAVVIGSEHGRRIRENYLFNIDQRFRVYIFPNNTFSIMTFLLLFSIVTGLFLVVMLVFAVIRFFQHSSSAQRGRLSSRHLKQLQTSTYSKGDGSDSCAICLEEYKDQDKLRLLPCSHGYHARCIDPWLTNNRPICPVCKQKVVLEGLNSDNSRDSDFEDRSETTPLLRDRKETQHGTFNLIYNPAGEDVGDLNLPSTSASENIGRTRVLGQSVSSSGGVDLSDNSVNENLSGNNESKDSAPKNVDVIKRLVFLKKSSQENLDSSIVSSPSSGSAGVSADPVAANLTASDLPGDSAVINITDVDLSNNSLGAVGLSSNHGTTNKGDGVMSSTVLESLPERNQSSVSAVANIGGTNLPGDTMTGYVAGMNLSKFWPSDHLNKIKLSKDSLTGNQDGLNISSDVSASLGGVNLPSDTNVKLGSESASIGDINLPNESMSVNLGGTNLSGESVVANLGNINVSTDSVAANIGGVAVPSDSVTANLGGVNVSSDLNRSDLSGIVEAIDSATANFEAFNAPSSPDTANIGVRVSKKVVPINLGIDLPGESSTANLDGSNILRGVSVSSNLGGVNISSPSISANLGAVSRSGISVSSPSVHSNLRGINVSSPTVSASHDGRTVSSPSVAANLRGIDVSSPAVAESHGGMTVSSPSVAASFRGIKVSSPTVAANLGGINVSSPTIAASHGGMALSSPSAASSQGGITASSTVPTTKLGANISSSAATASLSDASLSNKPAANRRRRRNFK